MKTCSTIGREPIAPWNRNGDYPSRGMPCAAGSWWMPRMPPVRHVLIVDDHPEVCVVLTHVVVQLAPDATIVEAADARRRSAPSPSSLPT